MTRDYPALVQFTRVALRVSFAMSEQEIDPSVVLRIIIKFLTNEGEKPLEILR